MDKQFFFERNLLALSQKDPHLCSRLSGAQTTLGRYKFLDSRIGEPVPALVDSGGTAHPLHSLVNPRREGSRLIAAMTAPEGYTFTGGAGTGDAAADGYLVFFGLGGGFYPEAALEWQDIHHILVIDFDIDAFAELLTSKEYVQLFNDPRFSLLIDPAMEVLEQYILDTYQPVLHGGIRVIPLRPRTEFDRLLFGRAGDTVKAAIDRLAGDYSVQAYFGTRWFSNIIRNVFRAEKPETPLPPIRRAAICAAGPSLDAQIPILAERRRDRFLIAADTALPALLRQGLEPDAVVSIDCQHISYYHFMQGLPAGIPLFLDLASPPLLSSLTGNPRFFSGGHPLTRYISQVWRPFPALDTSGANVTYAALSLADYLGAADIELYGADFSYPLGRTYARGAYIHPYFENRQNRLTPLEALASNFLYRSSAMKKIAHSGIPDSQGPGLWYYETPVLRNYREGLEAKAHTIGAKLTVIPGNGAPIAVPAQTAAVRFPSAPIRLFSAGRASMSAGEFLSNYREGIKALPPVKQNMACYIRELGEDAGQILLTLLPGAAALKRRQSCLNGREILEAARDYCLRELDFVLARE
ncbi:hypothetical protein AGMMS49991_02680 [Spirochaetia bacterium]|nr:hypothetical protein AGMMS49991_02680 [Spirochaetia bacterium]